MSIQSIAKLIGKDITLRDQRTNATYTATILDVKESYGNLRLSVEKKEVGQPGVYGFAYFQPTTEELASVAQ